MARETAGFFVDNFDGTRIESSQLPRGWVEVDQQTGQMFFRHVFMGGSIQRELVAGQNGTGVFNPFNVSAEGAGSGMHFIETDYGTVPFSAGSVPGTPVENLASLCPSLKFGTTTTTSTTTVPPGPPSLGSFLAQRVDELQKEIDSLEEKWDLRLPPVAVITPPGSAAAGTMVTFDSSGSSGGGYTGAPVVLSNTTTFPGDAGDLTVAWDFGGNAVFEPTFGPASATPTVVFPVAGTFTVILTVRDEFGRTYPEFGPPNFAPAARTSVSYVVT